MFQPSMSAHPHCRVNHSSAALPGCAPGYCVGPFIERAHTCSRALSEPPRDVERHGVVQPPVDAPAMMRTPNTSTQAAKSILFNGCDIRERRSQLAHLQGSEIDSGTAPCRFPGCGARKRLLGLAPSTARVSPGPRPPQVEKAFAARVETEKPQDPLPFGCGYRT